MTKIKGTKFISDEFVLVEDFLTQGTMVLTSSNSLKEILSEIPQHLFEADQEMRVCQVVKRKWIDRQNNAKPARLHTLFRVNFEAEQLEENEEDEVQERGNGLAGVGDYVAGDGEVYLVVETYGRIHTGQPGESNYIYARVKLADWSDINDDNEPTCSAVLQGSGKKR